MADTDPFGRDKGEDPLAAMGWSHSAGVDTARATDVAAPETPDRAAQRTGRAAQEATRLGQGQQPQRLPTFGGGDSVMPSRRTRVRGLGCIFGVVVLLIVGSVGVGVVATVEEGLDSVEDVERPRPVEEDRGSDGDRGERQGGTRGGRAPRGLERNSMLRRGNLAPALRRLRQVTKADRVSLLRVDPDVIVVNTVRGGRTQLAHATWKGEVALLSSSPGGGGTTFAWSLVDASAPHRIARVAARARGATALDYVTMIDPDLGWTGVLKNGKTFGAELDGGGVTGL